MRKPQQGDFELRYADKLTREEAITDVLKTMNEALGDQEPNDQAIALFRAVSAMRSKTLVALPRMMVIDYLEAVQNAVRSEWLRKYAPDTVGVQNDASVEIGTPIGPLSAVTWKREWKAGKRDRITWATEYALNGEPITVAEIRAAGLAQRPTTRNRKKER